MPTTDKDIELKAKEFDDACAEAAAAAKAVRTADGPSRRDAFDAWADKMVDVDRIKEELEQLYRDAYDEIS